MLKYGTDKKRPSNLGMAFFFQYVSILVVHAQVAVSLAKLSFQLLNLM